MSEVDPFLNQVRQGADYLRGLRTPLRRGVAVAGGVVLAIGSLSACGDSPDARAEGTQVGAGVAIESESPDNTGASLGAGETTSAAATESPNSTPAPAETPRTEATFGATGDPVGSGAEVFSEGVWGRYDELIKEQKLVIGVGCSGATITRVTIDDFSELDTSREAEIQVVCGAGGKPVAGLVYGASDITPQNDILFMYNDQDQGRPVVGEFGLSGPEISYVREVDEFKIREFEVSASGSCTAVILNPESYTRESVSYVEIKNPDSNNTDIICGKI